LGKRSEPRQNEQASGEAEGRKKILRTDRSRLRFLKILVFYKKNQSILPLAITDFINSHKLDDVLLFLGEN